MKNPKCPTWWEAYRRKKCNKQSSRFLRNKRMGGTSAIICKQIVHVLLNKKKALSQMDQLRNVLEDLEQFKSAILDMLKDPDESQLQHMDNLKELHYRIEDILETYAVHKVEAEVHRENRKWVDILVGEDPNMKPLISSVVDAVATRRTMYMLSDLAIDMLILGIPKFSATTTTPNDGQAPAPEPETPANRHEWVSSKGWPKRRYAVNGVDYFVGRNHDLFQVSSYIYRRNPHPAVTCIWGERGLGKSAMAWKIYTDSNVRRSFKAWVWVTLTNESQVYKVVLDILRQLGVGDIFRRLGVINLRTQFDPGLSSIVRSHFLESIFLAKNCLIVVDHIEQVDKWKGIFSSLQGVGSQTKILITTSNWDVVYDEAVCFRHELNPLTEDDGWELLKKYAFSKNVAPDVGMFPKVGREMVRKCNYLPIAISSVGRKLSYTSSKDEGHTLATWHTVNNSLEEYLSTNYGIAESEEHRNSFSGFDRKYQCFPYNLRQCFLYLGCMSKQNESVDAQDLMLLWVGEGMVSSIDIAKNNLSELAEKKILQVQLEEFSSHCRLNLCRVERHVRDFSLYQGVREDFRLKVVDFCDDNLSDFDSSATLNDETRRLVVHFNERVEWKKEHVKLIQNALAAMGQIRSLLFLNSGNMCVDLPLAFDFAKLKLLRVVHFVRCKFQGRVLPAGINKLANLRYIGLVCYDLEELSLSISHFRNLNVFNLRAHRAPQTQLQDVLYGMTKLRHLCLPHYSDTKKTKKLRLDRLRELETLVGFNSSIHDISSLSRLENLRHLVAHAYSNDDLTSVLKFIQGSGNQLETNLWIERPCDFTSPVGLAVLEETLMCRNLHELTLSMVDIHVFPDCGEHFSKEMNQIKLIGCKMKQDPMEALGKFPNLKKLCLGYGAYVGTEMKVGGEGFESLEYLEMQCLPKLEKWKVHEKAMPKLCGLIIRRCPKLMDPIPIGFINNRVPTLKSIYLELSRDALSDVQRASYDKISKHVPSCSLEIKVYDPVSQTSHSTDYDIKSV